MVGKLPTPHGDIILPAFLPDATRAVIKSVDSADLEACGVNAIVVNTFHLLRQPGVRILSSSGGRSGGGGVHGFMSWDRPIVSDSGGFQIYSLLAKDPKLGSVTRDGFVYRMSKGGKRINLTPAKSIQRQFRLGADIMICLDQCMHPNAPANEHRESVENTVAWARECRKEFEGRLAHSRIDRATRPLLFAVIQGGEDFNLRKECAERLIEIGFDGYCFGGWPLGDSDRLVEAVEYVAGLMPADLPRFALGICGPEHIVASARMGYDLSDGALPTRDARRKRLYIFSGGADIRRLEIGPFYSKLYMQDSRHADDHRPVDESCDCLCCARYSRSYLHHLFDIEDPLAFRLATIHNLRFYMRLMALLQQPDSVSDSEEETTISWAVNVGPLLEELRNSRKYRYLCDDTLGRIAEWAVRVSADEIEAAKKAKRKIHQVFAAFLDSFDFELIEGIVESIPEDAGHEQLKPLLMPILQSHTSTSERISILDRVYPAIFEITGKPGAILDIACGLNPFAIPWMDLDPDARYVAFDIDKRMVDLLNRFMSKTSVNGEAFCRDVLVRMPDEPIDLAFMLKIIPSLEQQEKGISRRLLESIPARYIVVSFPISSIGGHPRGMRESYTLILNDITQGLGFTTTEIEFPEEIFFILRTQPV